MHVFSVTKGRLKEIKINQLESRAQELNISKKLNFLQSDVQKIPWNSHSSPRRKTVGKTSKFCSE